MSDALKSKDNMEEFFQTVGEVRSLIEKISHQAKEVEQRHASILSSPNQNSRHREEAELLNNETKRDANSVRAKLKAIQDDLPPEDRSKGSSVIQRIQKNQHSHLTRWFAEVMRDYHKTQISFREKCKAQIQRQLEIVNKVTTDEELEELLKCEKLAIFICDDIICLESSIKELHEIFADTAMLLEIQGELINSIEKNVMSAAEYVDVSRAETDKAVMYKKNPHKIARLPSFFRRFKRQTAAKTGVDQNGLKHD
ncbi:syntaxin-2-like isoform 2-T2 [Aulostomus maculatus]